MNGFNMMPIDITSGMGGKKHDPQDILDNIRDWDDFWSLWHNLQTTDFLEINQIQHEDDIKDIIAGYAKSENWKYLFRIFNLSRIDETAIEEGAAYQWENDVILKVFTLAEMKELMSEYIDKNGRLS